MRYDNNGDNGGDGPTEKKMRVQHEITNHSGRTDTVWSSTFGAEKEESKLCLEWCSVTSIELLNILQDISTERSFARVHILARCEGHIMA